MRTARRRSGPVLLVVVLALLAGCTTTVRGTGTPPPDAQELLADAVDALGSIETGFAITLTVTVSSRTLAVTSRAKGDNGSAKVDLDGEVAEVLNVDGEGFIRATAGFWTGYAQLDPGVAARLDTRWVELAGPAGQLQAYVSQPGFRQALDTFRTQPVRLAGRTEVGFAAAWKLEGDTNGTIAVSRTSSPQLLEFGSDSLGTIRFTYPTDEVTVTAPEDPLPYPS